MRDWAAPIYQTTAAEHQNVRVSNGLSTTISFIEDTPKPSGSTMDDTKPPKLWLANLNWRTNNYSLWSEVRSGSIFILKSSVFVLPLTLNIRARLSHVSLSRNARKLHWKEWNCVHHDVSLARNATWMNLQHSSTWAATDRFNNIHMNSIFYTLLCTFNETLHDRYKLQKCIKNSMADNSE